MCTPIYQRTEFKCAVEARDGYHGLNYTTSSDDPRLAEYNPSVRLDKVSLVFLVGLPVVLWHRDGLSMCYAAPRQPVPRKQYVTCLKLHEDIILERRVYTKCRNLPLG